MNRAQRRKQNRWVYRRDATYWVRWFEQRYERPLSEEEEAIVRRAHTERTMAYLDIEERRHGLKGSITDGRINGMRGKR